MPSYPTGQINLSGIPERQHDPSCRYGERVPICDRGRAPMKIVMTLLVKDEIDIVESNMKFHLESFVDALIVTDNGSTDGTRDLLADYAARGDIILLDEAGDDYDQSRWVTRMALMARDELGADWIVNNDADEFWVCDSGDMHASLAGATAPIQRCARLNLVAPFDGSEAAPWHERLIYRVATAFPRPQLNDYLRDPLPGPYFFQALPGKTLLQAKGLARVRQGNHNADYDSPVTAEHAAVSIYHYPVRSRAQFIAKITQGGAAYARNTQLPVTAGWHWRRLYRILNEEGADAALADALPCTRAVRAGLQTGAVIEDRSMVNRLRDLA